MMSRTKLVTIIAVTVFISVTCSSCKEDKVRTPFLDDGSNYTGFSNISQDYNAADAAADGCLVINTVQGTNKYGATVTEKRETAGYENWQGFLEKARSGRDAFLRIAHFIDGVGYYHDLHYCDGKYIIFDYNENGVSKGAEFQYLRRLDGYSGPATDPKENCFYVLTDSMELTYDDVNRSFLSSDLSTVTDIPFEWLGFMVFFE